MTSGPSPHRSLGRLLPVMGLAIAGTALLVQVVRDRLAPLAPAGGASEANLRERLADSPYDRVALRNLALAARRNGREADALALVRLGGRLGWRDSQTQIDLIDDAVRRRDDNEAMRRIDSLLRRKPALEPLLLPLLHRAAENENGRKALLARLAAMPPWRASFFQRLEYLPPRSVDAHERVLAEVMERDGPHPGEELIAHVEKLADRGDYARARKAWITLSRVPESLVLDPDFTRFPVARPFRRASPFEWTARRVPGTALARPEGSFAQGLRVDADRSTFGTIVSQHIVLPPARYDLTVSTRSTQALESGALRWNLTCLPSGRPIGASGKPVAAGWHEEVAVPRSACTAQLLSLEVRRTDDPAPTRAVFERIDITPATVMKEIRS